MDKEYTIDSLPKGYRKDVKKAVSILTKEGCKEIYLFGSLVNGDNTGRSDIDLAATGIRQEDFFEIYGKLMMELEHPVDLINLEKKNRFVTFLKEKGELVRVA